MLKARLCFNSLTVQAFDFKISLTPCVESTLVFQLLDSSFKPLVSNVNLRHYAKDNFPKTPPFVVQKLYDLLDVGAVQDLTLQLERHLVSNFDREKDITVLST